METPALGETHEYVHDRDIRLWERGVEDPDFLAVRVGIARSRHLDPSIRLQSSRKLAAFGSRSRISPKSLRSCPTFRLLNVDLLGGFGLGITGPPAAANTTRPFRRSSDCGAP